jgi:hypothetical protein
MSARPSCTARVREILRAMKRDDDRRFALAELSDLIATLPSGQLASAIDGADLRELSPLLQNYIAAMVEQAAHDKGVSPPEWARHIPALEHPWFATPMPTLRLHLLRASPVPFKRRNLFVDPGAGRV